MTPAVLPRKLLIFQPVRDDAVDAEAALFVFLVISKVAFEPFDMAAAFEGEHMGRDAIEKKAVMRDDHRAAGEIRQRLFKCAKRIDIEIVGRLVEQKDIGAGFQHFGEMHAVALAAGELADFFLLIGPLEIEGRRIGARIDLALAEREKLIAAGNLFPDGLLGIERSRAIGRHSQDARIRRFRSCRSPVFPGR